MHRSGTSLVASLLAKAGIDMGARLVPAAADNPRGYYEDADIVEFHDRCLARRGVTYAEPRSVAIELTEEERDEARGLVAARADAAAWGWKDPRTCLFVDEWHRLVPGATFIVVHRHPLAVLASLLRRREHAALADAGAGLGMWTTYTQAVVDFLDRATPPAVVVETAAVFSQPEELARLLGGVGVDLTAAAVRETAVAEEFAAMPGLDLLEPVAEQIEPSIRPLYRRLRERSALVASHPPLAEGRAGAVAKLADLAASLPRHADVGYVRVQLLLAGMCLLDPRVARSVESGSLERALAAERDVARRNFEGLKSAETASRANLERAEHAERIAGERDEAARAAVARLASTSAELDEARQVTREATFDLERARDALAGAEQLTRGVIAERNFYRRRWPPHAMRRLRERIGDVLDRRGGHRARARFGVDARVVVLFTGLPEPAVASRVAAALASQTRRTTTLVLPGHRTELERDGLAERVVVYNWWSQDLPWLLQQHDYAAVLHPELYGAGPLDRPEWLELAVAGLAASPRVAAVVWRGADAPGIDAPAHVQEMDWALATSCADAGVAAVFRAGAFREAFPPANAGETRNVAATVLQAVAAGQRVVLAPRRFPLAAERRPERAAVVGPTPRTAVRGLYVTQWLECGGADKGAVDLLTRLDPEVVQFSLMTTLASRQPWAARVQPHVREVCHLGEYFTIPSDERFSRFLVEYVRRRDIGLVHVMHSFAAYDALPALRRELPRVKIVDQCHILEPPDVMEGGHPAYSSRRYKQYFDHRTVTSEWLKRYLVEQHGVPASTVSVIHTGVDWAQEFDPARYPRGEFRARLGIPDAALLVVFIGRVHRQKRPWLFARVAAEVQRRRPNLDAYFAVVGDGDALGLVQAARLELPEPGRLLIAGEVGHSAPVFRDADLLLMPSGHEGLAFVSFEAMAMGVPQVFTDVNAQRELITPETGILVPADPDEAVVREATAAVTALLDDATRRRAMGEAARRRVREHFGVDRMVREYEAVYRRLRGAP